MWVKSVSQPWLYVELPVDMLKILVCKPQHVAFSQNLWEGGPDDSHVQPKLRTTERKKRRRKRGSDGIQIESE